MTEDQRIVLVDKLEAKAAEFLESPQKGLSAGYRPEQVQGWGSTAVGQPRKRMNTRSPYEACCMG